MISPERLRFYPFFAHLTPANLATLADIAEELAYEQGEIIFEENEELDRFYFIEKGAVALLVHTPIQSKEYGLADQLTGELAQQEVVISALGPGDVFGWSALVPPHESTATVKAVSDCRLLAFPRLELEKAFREDCRFGYLMMMKMAQVIRRRFQVLRMELLADKMNEPAPG